MLYKSSSDFKPEDVKGCRCSLRNSGKPFPKLLTHRDLRGLAKEDVVGEHSFSPWLRSSDQWCFAMEILFRVRPVMDKPCSSRSWLALLSSSFDPLWPSSGVVVRATSLNPVFFLGIISTFRSAFVSLDWEKPTILQAYLRLPGTPSPFLSYPSSLFLLCILAAFIFPLPTLSFLVEFLPSLLHWDCSWLNPQIITSWPNPKASCLSLALTCFRIHCSWPLYPLQFTLFSVALGSYDCFEEWLVPLISKVCCSATALAAASSPYPPPFSI